MAENNTVLVIAVLAVIASLAAAGFSYYSLSNQRLISGYASSTGTANLTVLSSAVINFSVNSVVFGSGRVNLGQTNAVLETTTAALRGNWSGTQPALVLDNLGNVNVTLDLKASTDAAGLLGGTSPAFKLKVTETVAGGCLAGDQSGGFGTWMNTNTTDLRVCGKMSYLTGTNKLTIGVQLTVPQDSKKGDLEATITATGTG